MYLRILGKYLLIIFFDICIVLISYLKIPQTGLRLHGSDNTKVSKNWTRLKLKYSDRKKYDLQLIEKDNKADKHVSSKSDHVKQFIRYTARYLGEFGAGAEIVHIIFLPYETNKELYGEYISHYMRSVKAVSSLYL